MSFPATPPQRGEIYWVDFNPSRGSEQAGHRPAVVISLYSFNRVMPVVVVAAITSKIRNKHSPVAVYLPAGQPLRDEGCVLAFQVMTIDQTRLDGFLGALRPSQLEAVDRALCVSFGLSSKTLGPPRR